MTEWESRTLDADGRRVHVKIAGTSGPLVLLCHGFPESWYSWRHQMGPLADAGYRAVALDMPGYGRSEKSHDISDYRITELVAACVGVVHTLGEEQAIIVGHDWGAPVAWTAAWTRPDVFRAVAGLSVPFGARGLIGLLDDPFGEIRPSIAHRAAAGPDLLFYQEYFCLPGDVAAREADADLRTWLTGILYGLSADVPLPPEMADVDLTKLSDDAATEYVRAALCVPPGTGLGSVLPQPEKLPAWLTQEDLDHYVAEFERTGLVGAMNYYRNVELGWELLAEFQGTPLTVPALFIGGDRDLATIWGRNAIERAGEYVKDLRRSVIFERCGHWIQQEKPAETTRELLEWLRGL
ncbi:alpha/beta hydrolase [Pseudonocardia xishanensis]|uniref:Epoxide hydrolase EphB n=1 Tax=Pseudonocardia xishanensis TaxID=630995 RepID=A0ABP8RWL9_9PSEU